LDFCTLITQVSIAAIWLIAEDSRKTLLEEMHSLNSKALIADVRIIVVIGCDGVLPLLY